METWIKKHKGALVVALAGVLCSLGGYYMGYAECERRWDETTQMIDLFDQIERDHLRRNNDG